MRPDDPVDKAAADPPQYDPLYEPHSEAVYFAPYASETPGAPTHGVTLHRRRDTGAPSGERGVGNHAGQRRR